MAASKVRIRIRLKGYDHSIVDQAAEKIVAREIDQDKYLDVVTDILKGGC